jgi:AmiR/NasT family two-component response regulator
MPVDDPVVPEHEARGAAQRAADQHEIQGLMTALESRDVIGQAKGILMERHKITAEEAFTLLRRASQRRNIKLAEIAEAVATTGELLGLDPQ